LGLVAPLETVALCAGVLLAAVACRRVSRAAVIAVTLALAVGAWRAHREVVWHEVARAAAQSLFGPPLRCAANASVLTSPVRVRGTLRWDAWVGQPDCEGRVIPWKGRVTLYGGPDDIARGDELAIVATLGQPQRFWNPATGDPRPADALRGSLRSGGVVVATIEHRATGLLAWIDRFRATVRSRIDQTYSLELAPMARALVLGENDLSPEDDRAFRASGLSHLLAVSGMHLVLVLAVAVRTLEMLLVRCEPWARRIDVGRIAAAWGIPVAWLYAQIAGGGGSTCRAAWMATAALAARAFGRRSDPARAFGLSVGAMAIDEPLVAFDLSFVLSAAATSGLLLYSAPIGRALGALMPTKSLTQPVATTLAASVPCVPVLAWFAPTVPLGGVLANLLAVPLGECAALPLCLTHAVLAWWPSAERGCALVASGALFLVERIARGFSAPAITPQIPQPTSWQLVVIALALASCALDPARPMSKALASLAILLGLEVVAVRAGAPKGELRITFLDVAQGDAAIVDLPNGEAMIVDGGGLVGSPIDVGMRVLAPELRARRRQRVLAAILTHPHPDHFGGFLTGLGALRIDAFWDTGQGEREGTAGTYASVLDSLRAHRVPIVRPEDLCGAHEVGGARLEVLAPCPTYTSDWGPNDNSFVLRFSFGSRSLLLVGDAEREEEAWLLADRRSQLRADLLKVGHHGSRSSSSTEFLNAVSPRDAVVSVGARNRFGHPHPETIQSLQRAGIRTWRTDLDGAVIASTDGRSMHVSALAPR
jgi:competence protein ComEC